MTAYIPEDRPQLAVALDGSLAAVHVLSRVAVVEIRTLAAIAEVEVDVNAEGVDVAWIGVPPRLLVLTRYRTRTLVQSFDPHSRKPVAEVGFETRLRLRGPCGAYAVAIGDEGTGLLDARGDKIAMQLLPASAIATAACTAGDQLVLAVAGSVEEWDVRTRTRSRGFHIMAQIPHLGGTTHCVWLTTLLDPRVIEIVPLADGVEHGELVLPEPIKRIAGHPRADVVACIGAETGRLYVAHLDDSHRIERVPGVPIEAAELVIGDPVRVLIARGQLPLALVDLAGEAVEPSGEPRSPSPLDVFSGWRAARKPLEAVAAPPTTGTLVGTPGVQTVVGPCVVVAERGESLLSIAERCQPRIGGAILVVALGANPAKVAREALAHGVVPLTRTAMPGPAIIVVETEAAAIEIGLPRLL